MTLPIAALLVSCTSLPKLMSQVNTPVDGSSSALNNASKYPDSVMIYNVCHERWLRNGYTNYTFNVEEGTYIASREVQRGKFTQAVVQDHRVSQAATCSLDYHSRGASCNQNTRRRLSHGRTIDDFFAKWEKNPGLYQSCHPVLGYPTGYGHTYGTSKRRIDSNNWLIISSVVPKKSSRTERPAQPHNKVAKTQEAVDYAERRVASPTRVKPQVEIENYTSVTDLEIKLVSSVVTDNGNRSSLKSLFNVFNRTDTPALLGIKGWILDNNYKRYPLSIDGKVVKQTEDSEIVTLKIDPHTQMAVNYDAEGIANINVSRRTAAMLEIMSVDGAKVNLTLPNR